ncbi:hypothetical protein [Bradyrhizobium sp. Gha]|uniref:hypothetical protein n=1 Tax=Bradyrhizobium sp. Gha TaxID=1855318 RepID=UPI0008EB28D3|nr:hypothetical protein [Bradyrhizobium sp. Gha]SFH80440.1 hypothetical protein SAMN05216525_10253 [Bradyrhizobium sp. Gha]
MDNYRKLQRDCERQAALSSSAETKKSLREMAEEYRKMADYMERAASATAKPKE